MQLHVSLYSIRDTVRGRSRVVRERRELVESSTLDEVEEKG